MQFLQSEKDIKLHCQVRSGT